jgi:hypothetical protein
MHASHRVVSLLAVALLLSLTGFAEAQGVNAFWQELAGSVSGTGLSQTPSGDNSFSPAVAVGADGRPVVTYVESVTSTPPGPAPVSLLSAANFAILAGSTITSAGPTLVAGAAGTLANLGVTPGTAVTGFIGILPGGPGTVDGMILVSPNPTVAQAKIDLTTAFNDAAGRTTATPVAGDIGSQILPPGLYKSTSSLAITSGHLILDAQGNANAVWIFQMGSTLTTAADRSVFLINGAQASNVFWQVGSSATLGTNSQFKGSLLVATSITLSANATLEGRALAQNGVVALDSNTVIKPAVGSGAAGAIVVKRWTGTAWQTLSGAGGIGQGFAPKIRIANDGTYHVAWLQDDGTAGVQVHLLSRATTGSWWEQLGGSDSPGGLTSLGSNKSVGAFSLVVGTDNNPVVAFEAEAQTGIVRPAAGVAQGDLQVYVRRYNPLVTAWEYLGGDLTGGGASNAPSFLVDSNTNYAFHFATNPSLAVQNDGTLVVAFQYGTFYNSGSAPDFIAGNTEIFVTELSSTASTWTALGPAVPQVESPAGRGGPSGISQNSQASRLPALAIGGTSNEILVAWLEGNNVFARRWNGLLWEDLGGSGVGNGISPPTFTNGGPAVAVDAGGHPVVVWSSQNPSALGQIFVKRADSGVFSEMSPNSAAGPGISNAAITAFVPMVDASPAGTGGPAVIWLDQQDFAGTNQVFLRQYSAFTLNVSVVGGTSSSVSSTPTGIACPADCGEIFPGGQGVSLVATAGPNEQFIGWSGGGCTGTGACNVTMTANLTVTATFTNTFALTVSVVGGTGSSVSSTPTGIDCPITCSAPFPIGQGVALVPHDGPNQQFTGWSGACTGTGACNVTMSADQTVTATFANTFALTVSVVGGAGSSVSATPTGIDCPITCSAPFVTGQVVVLTPHARPNQQFTAWGGDCSGSGACSVTMTATHSVTATFVNTFTLTVSLVGNNNSSVTSTPVGIDCPSTCAAPFATPQVVTLTPHAALNQIFTGWGGDCSGTGTCTVTMTATHNVTATFANTFALTVSVVGGTGSSVTSHPVGIDCPIGCSATFPSPQVVALVANAGPISSLPAGPVPAPALAPAT